MCCIQWLHICFLCDIYACGHCQLFQECSILLSIQETLAGRSIWHIYCLLLVICSVVETSLKAAQEVYIIQFVLHHI